MSSGKKQQITLDEIEQWIVEAGSDHVPTFGGAYEGGIQLQQVPDEIASCIADILNSGEEIKAYLEIGSAAGGTAFVFDHFFKPETIVLIDDNKHPKAHVRPYILRDVKYTEIIGLSQAQGTVDAIRALGVMFDVIMVDGDHSYEAVLSDTETYADFLRPGGFIILHDSISQDFGVAPVVDALKECEEVEFIAEYITKRHHRPCGIAVFRKVVK